MADTNPQQYSAVSESADPTEVPRNITKYGAGDGARKKVMRSD